MDQSLSNDLTRAFAEYYNLNLDSPTDYEGVRSVIKNHYEHHFMSGSKNPDYDRPSWQEQMKPIVPDIDLAIKRKNEQVDYNSELNNTHYDAVTATAEKVRQQLEKYHIHQEEQSAKCQAPKNLVSSETQTHHNDNQEVHHQCPHTCQQQSGGGGGGGYEEYTAYIVDANTFFPGNAFSGQPSRYYEPLVQSAIQQAQRDAAYERQKESYRQQEMFDNAMVTEMMRRKEQIKKMERMHEENKKREKDLEDARRRKEQNPLFYADESYRKTYGRPVLVSRQEYERCREQRKEKCLNKYQNLDGPLKEVLKNDTVLLHRFVKEMNSEQVILDETKTSSPKKKAPKTAAPPTNEPEVRPSSPPPHVDEHSNFKPSAPLYQDLPPEKFEDDEFHDSSPNLLYHLAKDPKYNLSSLSSKGRKRSNANTPETTSTPSSTAQASTAKDKPEEEEYVDPLTKKLAEKNLVPVDIDGDGRCILRTFSMLLKHIANIEVEVDEIQRQICQELSSNWEAYMSICLEEMTLEEQKASRDVYVSCMASTDDSVRKDAAFYYGEGEIAAFQKLYDCNIIQFIMLHNPDGTDELGELQGTTNIKGRESLYMGVRGLRHMIPCFSTAPNVYSQQLAQKLRTAYNKQVKVGKSSGRISRPGSPLQGNETSRQKIDEVELIREFVASKNLCPKEFCPENGLSLPESLSMLLDHVAGIKTTKEELQKQICDQLSEEWASYMNLCTGDLKSREEKLNAKDSYVKCMASSEPLIRKKFPFGDAEIAAFQDLYNINLRLYCTIPIKDKEGNVVSRFVSPYSTEPVEARPWVNLAELEGRRFFPLFTKDTGKRSEYDDDDLKNRLIRKFERNSKKRKPQLGQTSGQEQKKPEVRKGKTSQPSTSANHGAASSNLKSNISTPTTADVLEGVDIKNYNLKDDMKYAEMPSIWVGAVLESRKDPTFHEKTDDEQAEFFQKFVEDNRRRRKNPKYKTEVMTASRMGVIIKSFIKKRKIEPSYYRAMMGASGFKYGGYPGGGGEDDELKPLDQMSPMSIGTEFEEYLRLGTVKWFKTHKNMDVKIVKPLGQIVHPSGKLSCQLDGVVINSNNEVIGIWEAKFIRPYNLHKSVSHATKEMTEEKKKSALFFIENGKIQLNYNHNYAFQARAGMAITGVKDIYLTVGLQGFGRDSSTWENLEVVHSQEYSDFMGEYEQWIDRISNEICSKLAAKEIDCKGELTADHPDIFCNDCDESIPAALYRSHLNSHTKCHVETSPGVICPETFSDVNYKMKHLSEVHNHPGFKCKQDGCKSGPFTSYNYLTNHMRDKHPEFRCQCEICGVSFSTARNLNQHKKIHIDPSLAKKRNLYFCPNVKCPVHETGTGHGRRQHLETRANAKCREINNKMFPKYKVMERDYNSSWICTPNCPNCYQKLLTNSNWTKHKNGINVAERKGKKGKEATGRKVDRHTTVPPCPYLAKWVKDQGISLKEYNGCAFRCVPKCGLLFHRKMPNESNSFAERHKRQCPHYKEFTKQNDYDGDVPSFRALDDNKRKDRVKL